MRNPALDKTVVESINTEDDQDELSSTLQESYQEAFIKAKTWLAYGTKRGDPLITDLSEELKPNADYLNEEVLAEADIETRGDALLQSIIDKRIDLGLPELRLFAAPTLSQIDTWQDIQEEAVDESTLELNFVQESSQ